jgi:hypothetical protein
MKLKKTIIAVKVKRIFITLATGFLLILCSPTSAEAGCTWISGGCQSTSCGCSTNADCHGCSCFSGTAGSGGCSASQIPWCAPTDNCDDGVCTGGSWCCDPGDAPPSCSTGGGSGDCEFWLRVYDRSEGKAWGYWCNDDNGCYDASGNPRLRCYTNNAGFLTLNGQMPGDSGLWMHEGFIYLDRMSSLPSHWQEPGCAHTEIYPNSNINSWLAGIPHLYYGSCDQDHCIGFSGMVACHANTQVTIQPPTGYRCYSAQARWGDPNTSTGGTGTLMDTCSITVAGSYDGQTVVFEIVKTTPTPTPQPTDTPTPTNTPAPVITPTTVPECRLGFSAINTPTPTPTPSYTIACVSLKAFRFDTGSSSWVLITDPSTIKVDELIRYVVTGTTDHPDGITKARFRFDGGVWQESIVYEPTLDGFFMDHTFTTTGAHSVEAMVFNPSLGWH